MGLVFLGIFWHVFAVTSMILLAPYGKKWEGFYMGLLLGPIGLVIAILLRDRLQAEAATAGLRAEIAALREEVIQRLPNGKPMGSQGF